MIRGNPPQGAHTVPEQLKIATWNVNSLRTRLTHVLSFLDQTACDVLLLQETKTEDAAFPAAAFEQAGYRVLRRGQKTYNGVALISREGTVSVSSPLAGIPGYPDPQARFLAACVTPRGGEPLWLASCYFPNGSSPGSRKFLYKLEWIAALRQWIAAKLEDSPRLIIAGDMNIAPEDRDVWDPALWSGQILVSDAERDAFRSLLSLGLKDAFRLFDQPDGIWSWWDYRQNAFRRNQGLRIDHVLVSGGLSGLVTSARVDSSWRSLPQPSDHAPVVCTLSLPGEPRPFLGEQTCLPFPS